ncbi:MAG: 4-hydroxy-3-methylbut-2-enyl diphosphate reductase [Lachnospiraceae bacterium]|nr:4-hydroxy-3-methylbut-2-enyl diphosphate reductase [Lachnospiraceae bacterium]
MKVTVAKSAGFCFGVKRAVGMAYREAEKAAENGRSVYTLGPVIHNEYVVDDLAGKGVRILDESLKIADTGEIPEDSAVVIVRSHGITEKMHRELKSRGWTIADATCPFVQKIHKIVSEKSRAGYPVIIIGSPEHPEVQGIRGWVHGPCAVVGCREDAEQLNLPREKEVCVVSQTTFNFNKFQELVEIIESLGYHVMVTNTICNATQERQGEAMELARQSDLMIVIGGRSSSNTQKLYEICRSECKDTYYIQTPDDLAAVCFHSDSCVGITAGASTPNTIIQEVSLRCQKN